MAYSIFNPKQNPYKVRMAHPGAWLFKKQKSVGIGNLFGSTSRKTKHKRRKPRHAAKRRPMRAYSPPRRPVGSMNVARTMGRGFGVIARAAGIAGKKAGTAAYAGAKQSYERGKRYTLLREKARRYGFKNLSHEEKTEYSKAALTKGHRIEG